MKIAVVAPSPVPFVVGGAEKLALGLVRHLHERTAHAAELIKLPAPESDFWSIIDSYRTFSRLDLSHFDAVVTMKYPSWMVSHPNKICYLQHKKRSLYDRYALSGRPLEPETEHPKLAELERFMSAGRERGDLNYFFALLDGLKGRSDLPSGTLDFPGPWIRAIVHYLDGIALSSAEVSKYAAISRTVAAREDYFPARTLVQVIHHPAFMKPCRAACQGYFFTASRLDKGKRLDLLVAAMRRSRADLPLKIAGTGPFEARLKEAAAGDPRIEFLGFKSDEEIAELYAGALAVLFVPEQEDYGLITVEALASGKPVLTATDSGGPTELVRHGENGWVVPPDSSAIAAALERICADPDSALRMEDAARASVADISWERTVEGLLGPAASPAARGARRPKITVAVSYPIYPVHTGAQARVFRLYRQLALKVDVDLVALGWPDQPAADIRPKTGMRVRHVRPSAAHAAAEAALTGCVDGIRIRNPSFPGLYALTPTFVEVLRESAASADLLVASHPFVAPALREASDKPLVYDAHNVEWDIKRAILPDNETSRELLALTRRIERECLRTCHLIAGCSEADCWRLEELYGRVSDKFLLVPNGSDTDSVPFVSITDRPAAKAALGFSERFSVVFMGSLYQPNIEAAHWIEAAARAMPMMEFWLLGGVCAAFGERSLPRNLRLLGVVDEALKARYLGAADVGLNPVLAGSGTSLKMLDYCSAGLPVLSTPNGVRGLAFEPGEHVLLAPLGAFQDTLKAMVSEPPSSRVAMASRARRRVEELYDWEKIAADYFKGLQRFGLLPRVLARHAEARLLGPLGA